MSKTLSPSPAPVAAVIVAYKPRGLTAEQWAVCAPQARSAVLAVVPQTEGAARIYLTALSAFLAGPAKWDKATTPDMKILLAAGQIEAAAATESFGTEKTRRQRADTLRALGRAIGAIKPTAPAGRQMALPSVIDPIVFPVHRVQYEIPAGKVGEAIRAYKPRGMKSQQWRVVRKQARSLVAGAQPRTVNSARVLFSVLVAFLRDRLV